MTFLFQFTVFKCIVFIHYKSVFVCPDRSRFLKFGDTFCSLWCEKKWYWPMFNNFGLHLQCGGGQWHRKALSANFVLNSIAKAAIKIITKLHHGQPWIQCSLMLKIVLVGIIIKVTNEYTNPVSASYGINCHKMQNPETVCQWMPEMALIGIDSRILWHWLQDTFFARLFLKPKFSVSWLCVSDVLI